MDYEEDYGYSRERAISPMQAAPLEFTKSLRIHVIANLPQLDPIKESKHGVRVLMLRCFTLVIFPSHDLTIKRD